MTSDEAIKWAFYNIVRLLLSLKIIASE